MADADHHDTKSPASEPMALLVALAAESRDPERARPFRVLYHGISYDCATNGVLALLVRGGTCPTTDTSGAISRIMLSPWRLVGSITAGRLHRWAPLVSLPPCRRCDGTGQLSHVCGCPYCYYTQPEPCSLCGVSGRAALDISPGTIAAEHLVDRHQVARVLAMLEAPDDSEIEVWALYGSGVRLHYGQRIALVAPVAENCRPDAVALESVA